ncbi:MAG: hypothetical protein B9S38_12925 [Verrucomicrobiia bacterium Tous-C4TDCM]|nr:MAG: hypothetical protein B9S38_12925 [Verrucomicrobiae bacterium Tous-C4TDCM]
MTGVLAPTGRHSAAFTAFTRESGGQRRTRIIRTFDFGIQFSSLPSLSTSQSESSWMRIPSAVSGATNPDTLFA